MRPIGEILELRRRSVEVLADMTYQEIGVRSFGNGLFIKPMITGADIGSKRVFAVEPGDLVVSNVFGWEGAVAVATSEHAGMLGSHRFMTWTPRSDDDVRYLRHFLLSEKGLADLGAASPGSAGRNKTLSIKNFEAIEIPLPDSFEQRRIAAHLDCIGGLQSGLIDVYEKAASVLDQAEVQYLDSLGPALQLDEFSVINPRPDRVEPETEVMFVPMGAVDQYEGIIAGATMRVRSELASGYKQFRSGDVIFARITPCMQNGKCAIYIDPANRPAYGSTEFHVLRCESPADRAWIHAVLRTRWFRDRAMASFTGTAGQQRVPASFLRSAAVPVPEEKARDQALKRLRSAEATRRRLRKISSRRTQLASSLLPAARNEVFSSLR